ncbi:MAG TPA: hypothetical protein VFE15_01475 [Marmoricola sp.]|jgi:hypothetical protein|nr:hypothetical protein [Marmoricola sp.]
MTALAPAPTLSVRPVRWHRLAWVTWRRYRLTLVGTVLVLAALAVELIVTGEHMRTAYNALQACAPVTSEKCHFMDDSFRNSHGGNSFLEPVMLLLPGILGVFAGAPLIARELESGTFRYAWTQGVGRMRWAIALLLPGALGIAALTGLFGMLVNWHQQPLVSYGVSSRLQGSTFAVTGVAAAAWALLGFALGALAGVAWRRVLPAVATAFVAWFGLAYVAADVLRNRYLSPLTTTKMQLSARNFQIDQWWTKDGVRVSNTKINSILEAGGAQISGHSVKIHVTQGGTDPIQTLLSEGYRQVTQYQPGSRYWAFQWIESGWLVVLAAALLGATFWLLRRRAA